MMDTGMDMNNKQLQAMGVDRAVKAIEHSIRKGWQGIFEEKNQNNNGFDAMEALKNM